MMQISILKYGDLFSRGHLFCSPFGGMGFISAAVKEYLNKNIL